MIDDGLPQIGCNVPCNDCPFRDKSHDVAMWPGQKANPGLIIDRATRGKQTCHNTRVDQYYLSGTQCPGALIFLRNAGLKPRTAGVQKRVDQLHAALGNDPNITSKIYASVEAMTAGHGKRIAKKPTRYIFYWNRCGRKGQTCVVTARGSMNSRRVQFEDGFVMVTSGNALRRADR